MITHLFHPLNSLVRILALCVWIPGLLAAGELRLPSIFSDNMVIQRGQPIPIWGRAAPGAEVTVSFRNQQVGTTTRMDGRWTATLAAESPGEPADLVVVSGEGLVCRNVLVGEVWVASGQSNMAWKVSHSNDAETELAAADHPDIRFFTVEHRIATEPAANARGSWVACTTETTGGFSAVAYYFGRELQRTLDVPIGLIHTSWGGTPAEAWTSIGALAGDTDLTALIEQRTRDIQQYPQELKRHQADLAAWKERRLKAKSEGRVFEERKPRAPRGPNNPHLPAGLFNAMLNPLIPYGIRGAIWYQGESNAPRPEQYARLFPTMIDDWRQRWGQGAFPFLFVQLANFKAGWDETERIWAFLREAQTAALRLPNTAMAVTIDIGNPDDIHPRNKQDVGRRLALAARTVAYGESITASGPRFRDLTIVGPEAVVAFDDAGTHLRGRGGIVLGFEIAGEDRTWVPARAAIDGDRVTLSSAAVPKPVAVRYAWANSPQATLVNEADLPAAPFRTDDWPRE